MKAIEILFEKIIELSEELKSDKSNDVKADVIYTIKKTAECIIDLVELRGFSGTKGEFY